MWKTYVATYTSELEKYEGKKRPAQYQNEGAQMEEGGKV